MPRSRRHKVEKSERYDLKLEEILRRSSKVFADKGYHNASMRDISRETGISLAGLYYYFETKEELLYLILADTFDRVLAQLDESVDSRKGSGKIRFFIENHLRYFADNLPQMKVASHESDSLSGAYRRRIRAKKKAYFDRLVTILGASRKPRTDARMAALALFGMINWIYTWYDPRKDGSIDDIAGDMADIFLKGYGAR